MMSEKDAENVEFQVGQRVKLNPLGEFGGSRDIATKGWIQNYHGLIGCIEEVGHKICRVHWPDGKAFYYTDDMLIREGVDFDE